LSNKQPWLKSMENGGLGEARAKAFLLERFWVLERSVDIQGADYLIQRRLTSLNFMDKEPPKLGVVQVKFIQDGATYVSINKDYVCNTKSIPYEEFFLLVFSGQEDKARSFLFSTRDIIENFKEKVDSDYNTFVMRGENIQLYKNFEIINKSISLNKIEHALKKSSFVNNRIFLSATNYIKLSPEQIDHDYLLPLDNGYSDLQLEFFKNKKSLQKTLFNIEEVTESIVAILNSTDPEEAFRIYEDVISDYIGGTWGTAISFSIDCFDDEEFIEAVKNHKNRLLALRKLGLENSFLALLQIFENSVITQTAQLNLCETDNIEVTTQYNSATLEDISISVVKSDYTGKCPYVSRTEIGIQVIHFNPWSWLSSEIISGKKQIPNKSSELENLYRNSSWLFRRFFQVELEKLLIGEELIAPWMRHD